MKKLQKTFCGFCAVLPLACFVVTLFASCSGGGGGGGTGIFAAIEEEKKLNKISLPNLISSIAVVGNSMYAANGTAVYSKGKGSIGAWAEDGSYGYQNVHMLASNDAELFALVADGFEKTNDSVTGLYKPAIYNVTKKAVVTGYAGEPVRVIDNQAFFGGRRAFVVTTTGVYELSGTSASNPASVVGASTGSKACALAGGITYFSDNGLITADFANTTIYRLDDTSAEGIISVSGSGLKGPSGKGYGGSTSNDYALRHYVDEVKNGKIVALRYYVSPNTDDDVHQKHYLIVATGTDSKHSGALGYRLINLNPDYALEEDGVTIKTDDDGNPLYVVVGENGLYIDASNSKFHKNAAQFISFGFTNGGFWVIPSDIAGSSCALYGCVNNLESSTTNLITGKNPLVRYGMWSKGGGAGDSWNIDG